MKCNICKAEIRTELESDHYYVFTKTFYTASDSMYEEACDIAITVCDACEKDLMRMYRELREDVAEHI